MAARAVCKRYGPTTALDGVSLDVAAGECLALARALAAGQRLLLLDEPFGALDAITRGDLQRTFQRLHRATGITVVLVTHDLHEAALLADRVTVMRAGFTADFIGLPDGLPMLRERYGLRLREVNALAPAVCSRDGLVAGDCYLRNHCPAAAANTTTSHGGAFHHCNSPKAVTAAATSRAFFTPSVQTGL